MNAFWFAVYLIAGFGLMYSLGFYLGQKVYKYKHLDTHNCPICGHRKDRALDEGN